MFNTFVKKYGDGLYVLFRIIVGLLFLQHGMQKLFGLLGGTQAELFSLMGLAGIIEFFGGLAIALGLFTRLAAVIGALEMIVAYVMVHLPQGWAPIQNQGELALLYFATFLVLLKKGSHAVSLEKALFKKEI